MLSGLASKHVAPQQWKKFLRLMKHTSTSTELLKWGEDYKTACLGTGLARRQAKYDEGLLIVDDRKFHDEVNGAHGLKRLPCWSWNVYDDACWSEFKTNSCHLYALSGKQERIDIPIGFTWTRMATIGV